MRRKTVGRGGRGVGFGGKVGGEGLEEVSEGFGE